MHSGSGGTTKTSPRAVKALLTTTTVQCSSCARATSHCSHAGHVRCVVTNTWRSLTGEDDYDSPSSDEDEEED